MSILYPSSAISVFVNNKRIDFPKMSIPTKEGIEIRRKYLNGDYDKYFGKINN